MAQFLWLLAASPALLLPQRAPSVGQRASVPALTAATTAAESELLAAIDRAAAFAKLCAAGESPLAPVTNLSLSVATTRYGRSARTAAHLQEQVEACALALEAESEPLQLAGDDPRAEAVDGAWRLCYSDASEITNLVQLPLGLRLRAVFQRVDLRSGTLENRAEVGHRWRLAAQRTRVVARAWADAPGAINRAGVANAGNRLAVQFTKVVVSLRRLLCFPTPFLRIVARPNGPLEKEGRVPTLDVTYVSEALRVSRGGDGSLFVLRRVDDDLGPLETPGDAVVQSSRGFDGATGKIERV